MSHLVVPARRSKRCEHPGRKDLSHPAHVANDSPECADKGRLAVFRSWRAHRPFSTADASQAILVYTRSVFVLITGCPEMDDTN
jgi:hypothetical protein